jgi:hypothetical protein
MIDPGFAIVPLELDDSVKLTKSDIASLKDAVQIRDLAVLQEFNGGKMSMHKSHVSIPCVHINSADRKTCREATHEMLNMCISLIMFRARIAVGNRRRLMLQVDASDSHHPLHGILSVVSGILEEAFPELKCVEPTLLLSLNNCRAQVPHCDGTIGRKLYDIQFHNNVTPLSAFMAFEADTKLKVWPRSHICIWQEYGFSVPDALQGLLDSMTNARRFKPTSYYLHEELRVLPYELLLFRQDLVHAGSAYFNENLRMHMYMDPRDFSSARNEDDADGESHIHPQDEAAFV